MEFWQSIIMGLVQGFTEFLPVSSSGHLALLKNYFNLTEIPPLYDVVLHIATLIVVLWVFRVRIAAICVSFWKVMQGSKEQQDRNHLMLIFVVLIATAITAVMGITLDTLHIGNSPAIVSLLFIVTGCILFTTYVYEKRQRLSPAERSAVDTSLPYSELSLKHGIITGIAQGFGTLPGISRSGITISSAIVSGTKRKDAGELSFLLSIPAIMGALVFTLKDASQLYQDISFSSLAAGVLAAMISGYVSIVFLMKLITRGRLYLFSFYLIPLGIVGLIIFI